MIYFLLLLVSTYAFDQCYIKETTRNCFKYYDQIGNFTCDPNLVITESGYLCEKAFKGRTVFTSVVLEQITSVDDYAFEGCSNLETFTFKMSESSSSWDYIGKSAFVGTKLKSINLNNIYLIDESAFAGLTSLQQITFYKYFPSIIRKNAFRNSGLQSIGYSEDVSYIYRDLSIVDEYAFSGTQLETFTLYENSNMYIGKGAFSNMTNLKHFNMSGCPTISEEMFAGDVLLVRISFSENVIRLKKNALKDCVKLTKLHLGNVITFQDNLQYITELFYHGVNAPSGVLGEINLNSAIKVYVSKNYAAADLKFLTLTATKLSCNKDQKYDFNTSTCVACENNYVTYDGCSDECTINSYLCSWKDETCLDYFCSGYACNRCTEAGKKVFDYSSKTCTDICNTVNGYYLLGDGRTCKNCNILNCLKCAEKEIMDPNTNFSYSSTKCTMCMPPNIVTTSGSCASSCDVQNSYAYYVDINGQQVCQKCSDILTNCKKCTSNNTCLECSASSYLLEETNECVSNCPLNYGKDSEYKKCVKCTPNCENCDAQSSNGETQMCKTCELGYYLVSDTNECVASCADYYYPIEGSDTEPKKCIQCERNCVSCSGSQGEFCSKCELNYFLYDEETPQGCQDQCYDGYYETNENEIAKCKKCSVIENCVTCESETKCTKCGNNQYVQEDGSCGDTCPEKYRKGDGICEECPPLCRDCQASGKTKCDVCELNAFYLDNKTCSKSCEEGYMEMKDTTPNWTCKKCDDNNCKTCEISTKETCVECKENFYYNGDSKKCESGCDLTTHFVNISEKLQMCSMCNKAFSNCQSCTSQQCTKCETKYYTQPDTPHTCERDCPDAYYKGDGVCTKCTDNCLSCDEYFCHSCEKKYVLSNGDLTCERCQDKSCLKCSQGKEKCDKCESPKLMGKDLTCVDTCESGYYSINDEYCEMCQDQNCAVCDRFECKECALGSFMSSGYCRSSCPDGYYENIKVCSECTKMASEYGACKQGDLECIGCSLGNNSAISTSMLFALLCMAMLLF
ncbi:hypothetical protein EIN_291610 [Entamoeba invadens IP1]|uniref:R-spondin Fu-CRD domain-containing protein n=1 Tax=Entamoeba invadens IP1 TaxID=370355 RepID=A0A0A1UAI4_ENTIV|nr:hypothetical protein EIN_291610 [Entamoeba invadens IP1]ELP92042.1 hypothetical protein EIN_291610 [Entamoeba invadens IP1]|eukprot:XP_004258813.1 hypothetical protein EIN_291610 [Entamoeba invadens IP1]